MRQTTFDLASAERIADVVRAVENPPQLAQPLTFAPWFGTRVPRQVRAATFTGAWAIGSTKVVTFKNVPTATASVQNLSWPITANHVSPENCVVGKDGTSWYLVVPVLQTATAVFVTATANSFRVTDIAIAATLNTNNCTITVARTLVTAQATLIAATAQSTYLQVRVP